MDSNHLAVQTTSINLSVSHISIFRILNSKSKFNAAGLKDIILKGFPVSNALPLLSSSRHLSVHSGSTTSTRPPSLATTSSKPTATTAWSPSCHWLTWPTDSSQTHQVAHAHCTHCTLAEVCVPPLSTQRRGPQCDVRNSGVAERPPVEFYEQHNNNMLEKIIMTK